MYEGMEEMQMLAIADGMIEQLKENEKDMEKFKAVAKERIDEIKALLEDKLSKLEVSNEGIRFSLLQIANMATTKETKTQRKLELLNGDVIIKKATKKFKNDNKVILEAVKEKRADLVKEKKTYTLDWKAFKDELEIVDNLIINTRTGEVVEVAGLEIEEVAERVEVK